MLRSLKHLEQYNLRATDGKVGKIADFYFDDQRWVIRYIVADRGGFLDDRQVLLSPMALGEPDWDAKLFRLNVSKERVRNSPPADLTRPVSRQYERDYYNYYGWPYYWGLGGGGYWGGGYYPRELALDRTYLRAQEANDDPELRSAHEVTGYHVTAQDGELGHVEDFICDDETWAIRYLVINTSNWWIGKAVLVAPRWIEHINWPDRTVGIDLSRDAIKASPEWTTESEMTRAYEERLFDHYGRPAYWREEDKARTEKRTSSRPNYAPHG